MQQDTVVKWTEPHEYNGSGCRKIVFGDLRDPYKMLMDKAENDDIPGAFLTQIVKRMSALGAHARELACDLYGHYFEDTDFDGAASTTVYIKEIASMDESLVSRIRRRLAQRFSNMSELLRVEHVMAAREKDEWVVKIVYTTELPPKSTDYNRFDEERQERETWSEPMSREQALLCSMWLAGALNVRHVDQNDLPQAV